MIHGNWVPISKAFLKHLPNNRPYTEFEAGFSLQVDYDQGNSVTVTGYSNLWQWSKGKVIRFLKRMNVRIEYPEDTQKKRNQNGLITVHKPDLKRTNNGLIRLIDNKDLPNETDLKRTKSGLITDLKQVTTKDTNTNPDPKGNTFRENSIEFSLAKLLHDLILSRIPNFKKPNLQKWAIHIDRAIRIDKRKPDEIGSVIRWCQADDFWQSNILSTSKLREKFDQLFLKMKSTVKKKPKSGFTKVNGQIVSETHRHHIEASKQALEGLQDESDERS